MLPRSNERVFVLTSGGKAGDLLRSAKKRGMRESRPPKIASVRGHVQITVFLKKDNGRAAA